MDNQNVLDPENVTETEENAVVAEETTAATEGNTVSNNAAAAAEPMQPAVAMAAFDANAGAVAAKKLPTRTIVIIVAISVAFLGLLIASCIFAYNVINDQKLQGKNVGSPVMEQDSISESVDLDAERAAAVAAAYEENLIGELEERIFSLSDDIEESEDEIIDIYEKYNELSTEAKRKVINRETIIQKYKKLESIVEARKAEAAKVDELIKAIDYSTLYSEASTLKPAVRAFNKLDEKSKKYLKYEDEMAKSYEKVGNLNIEVTSQNFYDLFSVQFSVGESSNYGSGISVEQDGYNIYWDEYGGDITPSYDFDAHNDYATPVYVYVLAKYPELDSSCYFEIDLHQTYNGLGIIDSDVHEYEHQQGEISYNSSMGIGEYIIYVENNNASSGIMDIFGASFDFDDMTHTMNPFDVSRVELFSINGSVSY